ncbi:MAG: undecaprenyl-diphosphate phosphatase [Planctomycetota bacterium]
MSLLEAVVLGIVQGLTEFLPVSSTAHLILVREIAGWTVDPTADLVFDIAVHAGTLVAVLAAFRTDVAALARGLGSALRTRSLKAPGARLAVLLVVGTIPAAVVGLTLKEPLKALRDNPVLVTWILIGASALLVLGEKIGKRERKSESLSAGEAFVIGVFQAMALAPGVSRSASTMTGGLLCGLERPDSARFAFLLLLPAVGGAMVLGIAELGSVKDVGALVPALVAGFITSAVTGFLCIRWLLAFLRKRSLYWFVGYRILAGAALLFVLLVLRTGN